MDISMGKLIGLVKKLAGGGSSEQPVVILPETELEYMGGINFSLNTPLNGMPVAGETYIVGYNGENYECKAIEFVNNGPEGQSVTAIVLGNTSGVGIEPGDENIPFCMQVYGNEFGQQYGMYLVLRASYTDVKQVTLSIVEKAAESADDGGGSGGWDVMLHIDGMTGNISEITDATKISFTKGSFDELVEMLIGGVVPRVCAYYAGTVSDGSPVFSMFSSTGVIMYSMSNGHNVKMMFVDGMGKRTSVTVTQYGFKISTVA